MKELSHIEAVLYFFRGENMQQAETISAIATARGEGGIGIIRLSGEGAVRIAEMVFKSQRGIPLAKLVSYQAAYGRIVNPQGEVIDEAICLVMRAPYSYTREDVVELQCHGGNMPLRETLELTWKYGARPAEAGEFTKRAFLNGRLDLSQAEAVMDVIQAKTTASLRVASGHLTGKLSEKIKSLRQDILEMIAHLEAAIDFPEDDIDDVVISDVSYRVNRLRTAVGQLLQTAHAGRILRDGLETAIIGKPNVGKSSLLNSLLQEERAIVTAIPGTTRDSIEEYADVGGVPLRIIDTAGIRSTDDMVEKMGVAKARAYVEQAALVLALFDSSASLTPEDEEVLKLIQSKDVLLLLTKADLPCRISLEALQQSFAAEDILMISTLTGKGMEELTAAIVRKVYGGKAQSQDELFVSNAREAEILRQASVCLDAVQETIACGMSADFIVIDLRSAWEKLGEITGETVGDDIVDQIFRQFCIGK